MSTYFSSYLQIMSPFNFRLDQWSTASLGRYKTYYSVPHTVMHTISLYIHFVSPIQPSKAEKIDAIICHALTEAISCQCNCSFPHDFIRKGKFSCLNTTTKVSYRSTIVGTTVHNASQLVNFIQKWVSTGPILEVEWWLLHVNANCPVRISSLSDSECQDSRPVACNPTMMAGDPLLFKCVQQSD